jgi:hypothetical protein
MKVIMGLAIALAAMLSITGSFQVGATAQAGNRIEPIYVIFFSHNEDDHFWQRLLADEQEYLSYRSDLIAKNKLLRQYHVVLNWESDHLVLNAMKKYEKGDLLRANNW